MVRLYYEMIERFYLMLLWVKYVQKNPSLSRIESDVSAYKSHIAPAEHRMCMSEAQKSSGAEGTDLDGLLDTLTSILLKKMNKQSSTGEGDLIDLIVSTLQVPFGSAVLSGRTMTNLRKALLLPEESMGLTERLRRQEKSCQSCGREFQHQEALVYMEGGSSSSSVIYCASCAPFVKVKCGNCAETVDFNSVYAKKRSKGCEDHKKVAVDIEILSEPVILNNRLRDRERGRVAVGRNGPIRVEGSGLVNFGISRPSNPVGFRAITQEDLRPDSIPTDPSAESFWTTTVSATPSENVLSPEMVREFLENTNNGTR